jgi:mannose PTS system EIIA component
VIGIVIAAHGKLGAELIRTAEEVVGPIAKCMAVDLRDLQASNEAAERFAAAVHSVDTGDGVVILTDMFGGTPANLGLSMLDEGKIEVLTGVNLPMLLKLATCRSAIGGDASNLHETVRLIKYYGQKNISVASEFLSTS